MTYYEIILNNEVDRQTR